MTSPALNRRFGFPFGKLWDSWLGAILLLGAISIPCSGQEAKKFVLGDLIEPNFTPPSLAEIDAKAKWKKGLLIDPIQVERDKQTKSPATVSVADALKLRNRSSADNGKILSALGRLPTSDSQVNFDSVLNRHAIGDVNSTNPILSSSVVEFDVVGLIGQGLFGFDATLSPFALTESVRSWEVSEDRLMDKIVIRDDLTWSDGVPYTAHDIVFSYKVIMTDAVPVPAQRQGTDKIRWIEAYDDHTLVIFHKESLATNIWNVNFAILPKHAYEKTIALDPTLTKSKEHVALEDNPVCSGPYTIKSRTRGQEILLERRESYYMHKGKQVREKPYFKTIRFRIRPDSAVALQGMQAGDIDEMILTAEQWTRQTDDDTFYEVATKARGSEWTEFHFVWNGETPFFSDKRVRKAMTYAYDHKELLEKVRYGLDAPCTGNYHPESRWAQKPAPKPITQDLDKAEKLLDDAGWTDTDGDGIRDKTIKGKLTPLSFTVLVTNRPDRVRACEILKESLERIGVECTVKQMEFTAIIEKLQKRDFQAAFGGWGAGADPDTSENIWGTKQFRNYANYSNPEVDKLFAQGRTEFDPEKRAKIYQNIDKILWEDQPYTWLYYQTSFYGFSKTLRGYQFSPRGPYHYSPGFSSIWKAVP